MSTFDQRDDFLRFVTDAVPSLKEALNEEPDLSETIAAPFVVEDTRPAPAGTRSDDLAALTAIGEGVKAAAGAGFFVKLTAAAAAPVAGAIVGILFAVLTIVRQALKKGATLSADEMAVLAVLASSSRALPATQIADAIARQRPDLGWDLERVTKVLTTLGKVRLSDGSIKAFVAQDADGNWSAVDTGVVL